MWALSRELAYVTFLAPRRLRCILDFYFDLRCNRMSQSHCLICQVKAISASCWESPDIASWNNIQLGGKDTRAMDLEIESDNDL
jgi:hypothetical protein